MASTQEDLGFNTHNDHDENDTYEADAVLLNVKDFDASLLPNRPANHSAKSGLNPLVDAASYLFSVIGKLKQIQAYTQLNKLQQELMQEVNTFTDAVKSQDDNSEYAIVCRYVVCATLDDIIANTEWGSQGVWDQYSILAAFNQDVQHQDKFFTIMERALKEPVLYIDLMELMYLCLSMGYKGRYRATEHSQYQLEQITNNLYKHIRANRGSFSKTLSPTPLKASGAKAVIRNKTSFLFIFIVTACIVMAIFIGLGYLMDVISNEAYKNLASVTNPVPHTAF